MSSAHLINTAITFAFESRGTCVFKMLENKLQDSHGFAPPFTEVILFLSGILCCRVLPLWEG